MISNKLAIVLAVLALLGFAKPSEARDVEKLMIHLSETSRSGVFLIMQVPANDLSAAEVAGTAFIVSQEGHFLTAAHVINKFTANYSVAEFEKGLMIYNAVIPNPTDSAAGPTSATFTVIDRDVDHDIALCKFVSFAAWRKWQPKPVPVFKIAKSMPPVGSFVGVIGFPLGTFAQTTLLGTIASLRTMYIIKPGSVEKDRHLIQIEVAGNKGNSGSPIFNIHTGEVIGMLVQLIHAQVLDEETGADLDAVQNSGLVMAVPAVWLKDLLVKNYINPSNPR